MVVRRYGYGSARCVVGVRKWSVECRYDDTARPVIMLAVRVQHTSVLLQQTGPNNIYCSTYTEIRR